MVGGFTKTWTVDVSDWSASSVTFNINVYMPSSKFESSKYGVRVFYAIYHNLKHSFETLDSTRIVIIILG